MNSSTLNTQHRIQPQNTNKTVRAKGLTAHDQAIKLFHMAMTDQARRQDFSQIRFENILETGIAALKGGDLEQARQLLSRAASLDPTDARAWLWLSGTTQDLEEQRNYLENALAADPNNAAARRGLVLLSNKIEGEHVLDEGQGVAARTPEEPEAAQTTQTFLCPNCGGRLQFDTELQELHCQFCGYIQHTDEEEIDGRAEQVLDFVLPTARGHRWAEAQHRLACERCGAISIVPVSETGHECPYCGSHRLFESQEHTELLDPQAIGLMQLDQQKAQRILQHWISSGFFIPDDLRKMARTSTLRPGYYPFWTFEGTLELQWSCEVNLGSSRAPNWVPQEGYEFENFDNILIPGQKALAKQEISEILPFLLDDVVEFKPEYLAGWTAMTYDMPLSDASLAARERVVRKVRRELNNRVEVGREKRNLRTGATNWSGMTYKYLLLPIWTGTYRYKGGEYRILINGQTGKITGQKPVDRFKVWATLASGFLTLTALVLILLFLALVLGWI
jgi:DNA-directed RNA polymerase subunit RPC12/RpoP